MGMRISTTSLYDQQTLAIDNLMFTQTQLGNELSTGKKLNQPSDDPSQISQDLQVRSLIANLNTSAQNTSQGQDELTQVDSTLGELTSALQSARQLTVEAASDVMSPANKIGVANQVETIITQLVGLANTKYGGTYLFSGTSVSATPPVQTDGTPINDVTFSGNNAQTGELYADGQAISLSTTLQQAFNFNASDGSLNVFQTLINLRNTLNGTGPTTINGSGTTVAGSVIDQSAQAVNGAGQIVDTTQTLAAQVNSFATPLQFQPPPPAAGGTLTFELDYGTNGTTQITIPDTDTVDGGANSVVGAINAQTAVTGVTATWDERTQKLTLSSDSTFNIEDVTGNFVEAFGLQNQAGTTDYLSNQLGDIDNVLTSALVTRAGVGQTIDTLSTLTNRYNTDITNDTAVQSQIEDANFPDTISQFTETQTALQAAYSTTTHLESHTLMDYL
jgi:flagellar hook-associated protein 3 FlgL